MYFVKHLGREGRGEKGVGMEGRKWQGRGAGEKGGDGGEGVGARREALTPPQAVLEMTSLRGHSLPV